MTKTFPVLLASLLAVSTASVPLQVLAQQTQPLDRIAAVVDEDVILQSELDRALANIKTQYAGRENQLPPDDVLSRQVLERLVLVKLQVTRAEGSGIRVSDQELNNAIMNEARNYPGQERQVLDFYRQNPNAAAQMRAPIYEEKVVDFLVELATVTERTVPREELLKEDDGADAAA